jgi:hypothetical protein
MFISVLLVCPASLALSGRSRFAMPTHAGKSIMVRNLLEK